MFRHRDVIFRDLSCQRNTSVAHVGMITIFKFYKKQNLKSQNHNTVVLKLYDSRFKHKFVAVYLLYAVCCKQKCLDLCDLN
jgi:hypothetical protein